MYPVSAPTAETGPTMAPQICQRKARPRATKLTSPAAEPGRNLSFSRPKMKKPDRPPNDQTPDVDYPRPDQANNIK